MYWGYRGHDGVIMVLSMAIGAILAVYQGYRCYNEAVEAYRHCTGAITGL